MKAWVLVLIGLAFVGIILFFAGLMKVASRSSQRDEAYLALHPPDRKDQSSARTLNDDSGANRCVCCGEIIPEGLQVCSDCEEKAKLSSSWW